MTRRRKAAPRKKAGHGVLTGMRSGVQKMAEKVIPDKDDDDEPKTPRSRLWKILGNVVTGVVVVVAGAVFLNRCGVIHIKF
jgi:hypothetical protein